MLRFFHQGIQQLFYFTSTDRGAFIVLIPLMILFSGWARISNWLWSPENEPFPFQIYADSVMNVWENADHPSNHIRPVQFDPNQLSTSGFLAMGLDSALTFRITRYREKGGRFRSKNDLLKIWGMDSVTWITLSPYIHFEKDSLLKQRKNTLKSKREIQYNLNLADTIDLESVPGIGKAIAARIMRYRNSLGGFIHRDQLYEVYGIDSLAVFAMDEFFIKPDFYPIMIDINLANYETLEAHPYISGIQAKAILFYRFQHGPVLSMESLARVRLMDEKTLNRLRPYIRFSVP